MRRRDARTTKGSASRDVRATAHHSEAPATSRGAGDDVLSFAHADREVAALAARQRGHVTTEQLKSAGLGRGAIARRVGSGRLHPKHVGVYAVGHTAAIALGAETAALLACGEDTELSHRSGCALWALCRPAEDGFVDVTSPRRIRRPGIRGHLADLAPQDLRTVQGLRVTAPARTLLDFAVEAPAPELERAVAEAITRRLVSERDLHAQIARSPGHHGIRPLGALLRRDRGPALTRSEAERRLLGLVRAAGLPAPEVNARLCGYEVDFLWRGGRLVVEVDGYAFHSSRTAFERDRRKDGVLADAGFGVRRVTWRQLTDEPERLLVALARALSP